MHNHRFVFYTLFISFFVVSAEANLQGIYLSDLQLSMDNFEGEMTAERFKLSHTGADLEFDQFEAYLEKESDTTLALSQSNAKVSLKNFQFAQYQFLSKIEFQNGHLDWINQKKFFLRFDYGSVGLNQRSQYLEKLYLSCKALQETSQKPWLFAICLESAKLTVPKLELDQLSFSTLAKSLDQKSNSPASSRVITEVDLSIHQNNFQLLGRTKILFNVRLTINGSIQYNPERNQILLKFNQVKAGIFSVKSRFLKELVSEGLTMNGDVLIISLD